jgi:hypothetical protein
MLLTASLIRHDDRFRLPSPVAKRARQGRVAARLNQPATENSGIGFSAN